MSAPTRSGLIFLSQGVFTWEHPPPLPRRLSPSPGCAHHLFPAVSESRSDMESTPGCLPRRKLTPGMGILPPHDGRGLQTTHSSLSLRGGLYSRPGRSRERPTGRQPWWCWEQGHSPGAWFWKDARLQPCLACGGTLGNQQAHNSPPCRAGSPWSTGSPLSASPQVTQTPRPPLPATTGQAHREAVASM